MKKRINIAVIGLGQIGIYLLNELNTKKKNIELKTGKKIKDFPIMTFDEFNLSLKEYGSKADYPDINN